MESLDKFKEILEIINVYAKLGNTLKKIKKI